MKILYNPSQSDFECEYTHTDGSTSLLKIGSLQTKKFNDSEALVLENRLVYHTLFDRGVRVNAEIDMREIRKEINGLKDTTI